MGKGEGDGERAKGKSDGREKGRERRIDMWREKEETGGGGDIGISRV